MFAPASPRHPVADLDFQAKICRKTNPLSQPPRGFGVRLEELAGWLGENSKEPPGADEESRENHELKDIGGNELETAKRLGIGRQTLYNKIKAYGIDV
jgi:DNA-binding NtrC family response regulator